MKQRFGGLGVWEPELGTPVRCPGSFEIPVTPINRSNQHNRRTSRTRLGQEALQRQHKHLDHLAALYCHPAMLPSGPNDSAERASTLFLIPLPFPSLLPKERASALYVTSCRASTKAHAAPHHIQNSIKLECTRAQPTVREESPATNRRSGRYSFHVLFRARV